MVSPRSDWTGGVAASHVEMEAIDDDEALAMTYAERLALVWQLSRGFDWSEVEDDDDGATVRLLGPDCGVRSAKGLARVVGGDVVGSPGCARAPRDPSFDASSAEDEEAP